MRITYDPEVDALYIRFEEGTVTTKHLAEGIAADYDSKGRLAGIEILDALKRFDQMLDIVVRPCFGTNLPFRGVISKAPIRRGGHTAAEKMIRELAQNGGSISLEHHGFLGLDDIISTGVADELHQNPFLWSLL